MLNVEFLWENYTYKGNSLHSPKDYPLWGSFTKDYKFFIMMFTIIFTLYLFLQDFLFTYNIFTSLDIN
jgi:hypothetical protein